MNTTVETKMNDPIQVNSKPANDESIVVDMDDKQDKKKISKIIERKKKVSIEKNSVFLMFPVKRNKACCDFP